MAEFLQSEQRRGTYRETALKAKLASSFPQMLRERAWNLDLSSLSLLRANPLQETLWAKSLYSFSTHAFPSVSTCSHRIKPQNAQKEHWRKARYVKHSQTLQPTQHQLLLCDWVLIKVLPRKTSLDPRSRRLYQVFLTPYVAVKYQGLKTWVRVLQRQVPAPTKDLLDPPAPLFHQADIITYQQSRVS